MGGRSWGLLYKDAIGGEISRRIFDFLSPRRKRPKAGASDRRPIDPAERIHGITGAELAAERPFSVYAAQLHEMFSGAEVLIGYNVGFDLDMLQAEFGRAGFRGTMPRNLGLPKASKRSAQRAAWDLLSGVVCSTPEGITLPCHCD